MRNWLDSAVGGGAVLWEHAAEMHFAICHNLVMWLCRGETTCQHKWTADNGDNQAENDP